MLQPGQWRIRNLTMGPGTVHRLMDETNPFTTTVRADQGGDRAWNHGSWSGAEWANERVVPIRVLIDTPQRDLPAWWAAHQQLAAAFAPVGASGEQVELRFEFAGSEFVLFGRPRMVEPDMRLAGVGRGFTRCAFVAQDPRIYSGTLHAESTGLPTQTGGLTVPLTVPFTVPGQVVGGAIDVVNEGTADAPLLLRIDGPVPQPRVILSRPDGSLQSIRMLGDVPAGSWLEIDTAAGTVFADGLPTASRRGQSAWQVDPYPLLPGVTVVRFAAADYSDEALLTATYRSAWW